MRIGSNPAKADSSLVKGYSHHRVIVPVYIPNQDGYFKEALEITRLSLESLHLTARGRVVVTVISNGCAPEVVQELLRLKSLGWIEQLIIDEQNRGKVNAVLSVARGAYENFLTIADADILYLPGWVETSEQLFHDFPECGFVAVSGKPTPRSRQASSTIVDAFLRRELRFKPVMSPEYPQQISEELSNEEGILQWLLSANRAGQLVVQRGDKTACVGGSHCIFTVRREVVDVMRREPILQFKKAEDDWIDAPVDVAGWWRLSPTKRMARHMGNTHVTWIDEEIERIRRETAPDPQTAIEMCRDQPVACARRRWKRPLPRIQRCVARWIRQALVPKSERPHFHVFR